MGGVEHLARACYGSALASVQTCSPSRGARGSVFRLNITVSWWATVATQQAACLTTF